MVVMIAIETGRLYLAYEGNLREKVCVCVRVCVRVCVCDVIAVFAVYHKFLLGN